MSKVKLVPARLLTTPADLDCFKKEATSKLLEFSKTHQCNLDAFSGILEDRYSAISEALASGYAVESEVEVFPEPTVTSPPPLADRLAKLLISGALTHDELSRLSTNLTIVSAAEAEPEESELNLRSISELLKDIRKATDLVTRTEAAEAAAQLALSKAEAELEATQVPGMPDLSRLRSQYAQAEKSHLQATAEHADATETLNLLLSEYSSAIDKEAARCVAPQVAELRKGQLLLEPDSYKAGVAKDSNFAAAIKRYNALASKYDAMWKKTPGKRPTSTFSPLSVDELLADRYLNYVNSATSVTSKKLESEVIPQILTQAAAKLRNQLKTDLHRTFKPDIGMCTFRDEERGTLLIPRNIAEDEDSRREFIAAWQEFVIEHEKARAAKREEINQLIRTLRAQLDAAGRGEKGELKKQLAAAEESKSHIPGEADYKKFTDKYQSSTLKLDPKEAARAWVAAAVEVYLDEMVLVTQEPVSSQKREALLQEYATPPADASSAGDAAPSVEVHPGDVVVQDKKPAPAPKDPAAAPAAEDKFTKILRAIEERNGLPVLAQFPEIKIVADIQANAETQFKERLETRNLIEPETGVQFTTPVEPEFKAAPVVAEIYRILQASIPKSTEEKTEVLDAHGKPTGEFTSKQTPIPQTEAETLLNAKAQKMSDTELFDLSDRISHYIPSGSPINSDVVKKILLDHFPSYAAIPEGAGEADRYRGALPPTPKRAKPYDPEVYKLVDMFEAVPSPLPDVNPKTNMPFTLQEHLALAQQVYTTLRNKGDEVTRDSVVHLLRLLGYVPSVGKKTPNATPEEVLATLGISLDDPALQLLIVDESKHASQIVDELMQFVLGTAEKENYFSIHPRVEEALGEYLHDYVTKFRQKDIAEQKEVSKKREEAKAQADAAAAEHAEQAKLPEDTIPAIRDPGAEEGTTHRQWLLRHPSQVGLLVEGKIVKRNDGFHVVSEDGKNLGGPYASRIKAQQRLDQVEMFKHMKKRSTATAKLKPAPSPEELAEKHKVSLAEINKRLALGEKVELEHTKDRSLARQIASHHISEFLEYYKELSKMETKLDKKGSVVSDIISNVMAKLFKRTKEGPKDTDNELV